MIIKGTVKLLGNDIDTDLIAPGPLMGKGEERFLQHLSNVFALRESQVIVAGRNFGCGSSREQAPAILKRSGIGCIVAKSFGRIFFRNSINIGLPVLICKKAADVLSEGDEIEVDLVEGTVTDANRGEVIPGEKLPDFLLEVLEAGGIIAQLKRE